MLWHSKEMAADHAATPLRPAVPDCLPLKVAWVHATLPLLAGSQPYMHMCLCVCIYVYTRVCAYAHDVDTEAKMCMYVCVYTYTHTHIHMYI